MSNDPITDLPRPARPAPAGLTHGIEDEVDFRRILDLVLSGKWVVLGAAAIALLIGIAYLLVVAPSYQADGLVQVEEEKSGSGSSEASSLLFGTPVQTEAEIQILKSRMVVDQVIDQMNLLVDVRPRYFPLVGHAFARRQSAAVPHDALFGLKAYAWGGEFLSIPTLEVPPELVGVPLTLEVTASGYELRTDDGSQLLTGVVGEPARADYQGADISMFVREMRARVGTQFFVTRRARQQVQAQLVSKLSVAEKGRQSGVIGITFTGNQPRFVSDVVNNLEDAYLRQNVERRSAEAAQSLVFLEKQLPKLKDQVSAAQAQLNAYQLQHGSVDVTKETEIVLQRSVELETTRVQLMQQREEALQRFTSQHPTVKALDDQIKGIESEQGKQKGAAEKLPTTQQEILSLMRDLDVANQLYTEMLNSVQQLQVTKAGTIGNVRIVDHAIAPLSASSPKSGLVIPIAIILGLIVGVASLIVQVALLRGIDDPNEVEARLGISAYAAIPYSSQQGKMTLSRSRSRKSEQTLLALADSRDLAIEALRSLRNSLHFLMLESSNNVLMLTGPAPGMGKSFVTANLGAVLAQSGKTVAVIDADLRKGHLHSYVGLTQSPGVSEYVAQGAAIEAVVRATSVPGLSMVTNGTAPPNPAELLLHERFAEIVRYLSEHFDYVLIDTPPVLPVADAAIVARMAGCTLIVLKSAEHPMREIEETFKRLVQAGANVRGTIFNQVGRRVGTYGYSYYRYEKYS